MDVGAWCGRCGQRFRLVELLEPPTLGECPRCGEPFGAGYAGLLAGDVRRLAAAAVSLADAGGQLAEVAPALHLDTVRLAADLRAALDH